MIQTVYGDVLAVERGIILHGCNAQGVMGSGIARQVKEQFPGAYKLYKYTEDLTGLKLGEIQVYQVKQSQKYIVNCITQNLYGEYQRQVDYEAVAKCMENLVNRIRVTEFEIPPICFPQIGAGLGGGNWKIISTIIDEIIPDKYEKILYLYKE